MAETDFLVLAVPLTAETRGMISAAMLAVAKPGQIVINIARGPVVDEEALISALRSGKIGGAALDVFCTEPLPESSPLWELENVLLSPHNADKTADFRHKSTRFFTENCKRFLAKEELLCQVDVSKGY